jgi:hypothetical protein
MGKGPHVLPRTAQGARMGALRTGRDGSADQSWRALFGGKMVGGSFANIKKQLMGRSTSFRSGNSLFHRCRQPASHRRGCVPSCGWKCMHVQHRESSVLRV